MRRSQADESRRRQAMADRRFRGHRIRGGLDDLGDLDAPQPTKQRTEPPAAAAQQSSDVTAAPPSASAAASAAAGAKAFPLLSSSGEVSATVFGADWAEWLGVKQVLFDTEATVEAKRAALAIVHVWHLRARKERVLPPYVEATAVLLDAMLQDEADALADASQRMCYGAAVSRAVHIMTGSFVSGTADTYRKRAQAIGFPEEAVEVRQRVAHGALPLNSELRWVCGLTLQFLFTAYWLEQERQLHLMEQVDKTVMVVRRHNEEKAVPQGKRRKENARSRRNAAASAAASSSSAAAAAAAAPPPPPPVSVDDMKALLADLEGGSSDTAEEVGATKAVPQVASASARTKVPPATAAAAESKGEKGAAPSSTVSGWLIS